MKMTKKTKKRLAMLMRDHEVKTFEKLLEVATIEQCKEEDVDGICFELGDGDLVVVLNSGVVYVE